MKKAIVMLAYIRGERTGDDPVLEEEKKRYIYISQCDELAAHQYSVSAGIVCVFIPAHFKKARC